jgi:hypothetical protein
VRYPYERFLRFLVSRKIEINSTLERYELPRVGDLWLADCRQHLRDTAPTSVGAFIDGTDTEITDLEGVLAWADAEGVGDLWRMQREFGRAAAPPHADLAFRLFTNVHTRAILGCLLLSRASAGEIQKLLFEHYGIELSNDALSTYRHIYWDVKLLSRKAWDDFYKKLISQEERSYVAFGVASPTAEEVRDMLGVASVHSDEQIVNTIINKTYQQFKLAMDTPQPELAGAMRWAELTLRALSVKKTAGLGVPKSDGTPSTADFQGLFSVKPEKSSHISLAQLAGQVAVPTKKTADKKES